MVEQQGFMAAPGTVRATEYGDSQSAGKTVLEAPELARAFRNHTPKRRA
jgi:hypothetical protein